MDTLRLIGSRQDLMNSLKWLTYTPSYCIHVDFIEMTNLTPPLFISRLILIWYRIKGLMYSTLHCIVEKVSVVSTPNFYLY